MCSLHYQEDASDECLHQESFCSTNKNKFNISLSLKQNINISITKYYFE